MRNRCRNCWSTLSKHLNHLFKPVDAKQRIYRRIGGSRRLNDIMPTAPSQRFAAAQLYPHRQKKEKSVSAGIEETTRRAILEHVTTCAVVVDRNMSVVYVHGKSAPYLTVPAGRMQNVLPLMAANGLQIRVSARPLGGEHPEHFICFFDRKEMLPPPPPEPLSTEQEADRRIAELEHVLKENREELSGAIEELEMSNE